MHYLFVCFTVSAAHTGIYPSQLCFHLLTGATQHCIEIVPGVIMSAFGFYSIKIVKYWLCGTWSFFSFFFYQTKFQDISISLSPAA